MDWAGYMGALDLPVDLDRVFVTELGYIEALEDIVRGSDIEILKEMLKLQLLWTTRWYLDDDIGQISFNFRGPMLSGLEQAPPPEELVLEDLNAMMGEAVGQIYVAAYFPPEAKAQVTELVDELVVAFQARLNANPWMSDDAKAEALAKLSNLTVKVGYPDVWRSYEQVRIGDSYAGSMQSAANAEYRRVLSLVGGPVDKTEWFLPPQIVNAGYDTADNSIIFPAAILQPPFFDYEGDAASNYGGIGGVIGHELTHGFDLIGSQFDARGNLVNWWTEEDAQRFDELNAEVVAEYDAVEVLPGLHVNGQITVTENVADLGGLQIAYDALQLYLGKQGVVASPVAATVMASPGSTPVFATPMASPVASPIVMLDVDALTSDQRFFISAATVWREKMRDEFLETLVRTDPHAPASLRATIPLQQMDAFYEAFDIGPGDPMYIPPEDRIVIW